MRAVAASLPTLMRDLMSAGLRTTKMMMMKRASASLRIQDRPGTFVTVEEITLATIIIMYTAVPAEFLSRACLQCYLIIFINIILIINNTILTSPPAPPSAQTPTFLIATTANFPSAPTSTSLPRLTSTSTTTPTAPISNTSKTITGSLDLLRPLRRTEPTWTTLPRPPATTPTRSSSPTTTSSSTATTTTTTTPPPDPPQLLPLLQVDSTGPATRLPWCSPSTPPPAATTRPPPRRSTTPGPRRT